MKERYLFGVDFDKTLSVQDTGFLLSAKLGVPRKEFEDKIRQLRSRGIAKLGGELSYLVLHDPDYRGKVTKELLREVGREIKLKENIPELMEILQKGIKGKYFVPYVISASPEDIIKEALKGVLPEDHIYGTLYVYDEKGVVRDVELVRAGSAKAEALNLARNRERIPHERTIYVGDGHSDMYVMLHVKIYNGYPIAVSPSPFLGHISRRTVLSPNALSILIPILEDIVKMGEEEVRAFLERIGHPVQEWDRAKIEWV
ncbi:MAG: HAD-IB family phosphatase, partial [Hadesarchaea archaeon]|nr:HAD-IB family phosphatase [Hadesarchaea archaeon]